MKNSLIRFVTLLIVASLQACSGSNRQPENGSSAAYQCPMKCEGDKTYDKPGKCPVCGMEMETVSSSAPRSYHMQVAVSPEKINAGETVTLSLTPKDSSNPAAAVPLDLVHEKKIHLIVVSKDLSWFEHIHPEAGSGNTYSVSTTFPAGGEYILFADYKPSGADGQVERRPVTVAGAAAPQKTYTQQETEWKGDDGYTVQLSFGGMPVKQGTELMPTVRVMKDGKPVSDLDNYLGALGHMVIISSDTKHYLHVHPMEDGTHGPSIMFHTEFHAAGFYRAFLQFNHGGKIHTADFVIEAK